MLRRAAGGSPAALRWLCDDCREVYDALGLIEDEGPERMSRPVLPAVGKALRLVAS